MDRALDSFLESPVSWIVMVVLAAMIVITVAFMVAEIVIRAIVAVAGDQPWVDRATTWMAIMAGRLRLPFYNVAMIDQVQVDTVQVMVRIDKDSRDIEESWIEIVDEYGRSKRLDIPVETIESLGAMIANNHATRAGKEFGHGMARGMHPQWMNTGGPKGPQA